MREILFRGKQIDNGKWCYGFIAVTESYPFDGQTHNAYIWEIPCAHNCIPVDPSTVGQFVGLTDCNKKKIFEGDIIKSTALSNDHNQKGATVTSEIVIWSGNACIKTGLVTLYPFNVDHVIEVIGNIHDNKDLLND